MSYLGKADCGTCSHEVDVRSNVRGMAYYKCGRCGVVLTQKEERGNRLFMAKIRPEADPDEAPEPARESPRIAAPQAPEKPGKTPEKTNAPAPRRGLFGGVLSGA